ncbi:universal stress protein [soil metagenome]
MKSILVHIHDDSGQKARLQAALDLTRASGGHLTCLQITPYNEMVTLDPLGGAYALAVDMAQMREAEVASQQTLEAQLHHEDVNWDWQHGEGDAATCLLRASRLADVVVVTLPRGDRYYPGAPLPIVGDLVTHCRSSVLALPPAVGTIDIAGRALVAWDGSHEAAVALLRATPLLKRASEVHVVMIEERDKPVFPPTDASIYLSRHGIYSELHEWPRKDRTVEEALIHAIGELKADWMVMGAFGHSRRRETIFGGVTRYLLAESPVPLLLAH